MRTHVQSLSRWFLTPFKGEITSEDSSDEELQRQKKDKKKEVLAKARNVKTVKEQQRKEFILSNLKQYEDYCEHQTQDEEEEQVSAQYSEDDDDDSTSYPPTPEVYTQGSRIRKSLFSRS